HGVPLKVVMTDFAGAIVEYWRTHPSLQPMVADGLLDFAYFDAERPEALTLLHSGESLAHGLVKNPIILLGNYFFDSIPQDCFTVRHGELYENLVTLLGPGELGPGDDPSVLEQIEIQYLSRRMGPERYDDPHLNEVLRAYQERVPSATFLLPAAGLRCLRFFEEMSGGRLMLLTADKAYHREEELAGRGPPVLDLHGSFSVMVNYHAMAEYVRSRGGQARFKKHKASILNVAAFLFGAPGSGYTETMLAFTEAIEESDPADFFALKHGIEPHYADLTLDQIVALLRLSGWDSNILLGCYAVLLDRVQSASEAGCRALREAIDATWENYLPIGEEHDVASCAGTLLASMRRYREAIAYFERSVQMYGPKPTTVFNMGMCYYELRQLPAALEHVKWALALDPHYEGAEALRSRLLGELAHH
ncbi:MAG TPA: hypothetical protein VER55_09235, partial [Ardenticatenaceae bacterium]|nr:hypothetical protein [Ardenticatenaceae bacterium]